MTAKPISKNTLAWYEQEHRKLAQRLSQIGFLWSGSLSQRYLKCGNPRCACQSKTEARHGPYFYWSTKKAGKTISRKLPPQEAEVLSQWIYNRQEVRRILDRMLALSQQALPLVLEQSEEKA